MFRSPTKTVTNLVLLGSTFVLLVYALALRSVVLLVGVWEFIESGDAVDILQSANVSRSATEAVTKLIETAAHKWRQEEVIFITYRSLNHIN